MTLTASEFLFPVSIVVLLIRTTQQKKYAVSGAQDPALFAELIEEVGEKL